MGEGDGSREIGRREKRGLSRGEGVDRGRGSERESGGLEMG